MPHNSAVEYPLSAKNCANACTLPNGLHAVGNGVSLLPWRKMTGVRSTGPPAPNPMTGTSRDASRITGKSAGSEVPTAPPAPAPVARAKTTASQAASVTGTRACRALCIALRKRLIPTLILVSLSECRAVIANSRGESGRASLPIGHARWVRSASQDRKNDRPRTFRAAPGGSPHRGSPPRASKPVANLVTTLTRAGRRRGGGRVGDPYPAIRHVDPVTPEDVAALGKDNVAVEAQPLLIAVDRGRRHVVRHGRSRVVTPLSPRV